MSKKVKKNEAKGKQNKHIFQWQTPGKRDKGSDLEHDNEATV